MITGEMTKREYEEIRAMIDGADAPEVEPFKPAVRVRRPGLGWNAWEKHKHKQAKKRKGDNRAARQARRKQRRTAR